VDAGSVRAYLAQPAEPARRAIVVLQEIFGVTRKIRAYCDLFARAGYTALAPDLFWRLEPDLELSHSEADVAKAFDLLGRFSDADALKDIDVCVSALRERGASAVAIVGFCLGGKLAALAATRERVDAAVSFYGVALERHPQELQGVRCPLQMHFGGKDPYIPEAARTAVAAALDPGYRRQLYVYPESGHAFFRPDLKDADSALAWERSKAFLDSHLGVSSSA
jgi:carboxymethylenebutenolidase